MPLSRFAALLLLVLAVPARAGLVSPTVRPVVFLSQTVTPAGVSTRSGYTTSVAVGAAGFGPATAQQALPSGSGYDPAALVMPSQSFPTGLTAGAVLTQAKAWVANNAPALATAAGAYAGHYGFTSVWFSYSQSVTIGAETTPRTLTWALFVDNTGRGTWGDPKLTSSSPTVLYVSYASKAAAVGIPPAWVTSVSPNAGQLVYQLLTPSLAPIQGQPAQTVDVQGAFDQGVLTTSPRGDGYAKLVTGDPSLSATAQAVALGGPNGLLATTGAAFALVDYTYPLEPNYEPVTDAYCPNGAASCRRAIGHYTYALRQISWCDCVNATVENKGTYRFYLHLTADRTIVDPSLTSQLLQEYNGSAWSPLASFDWTLTLPRSQAAPLVDPADTQVLKPTDGTTLIDLASLATPNSVLDPLPTVTQSGAPTDNRYWSTTPLPGGGGTYLAVQARCNLDGSTRFIAGYNQGAVKATDTSNGGFLSPTWASPSPGSALASGFATALGANGCIGYSVQNNAIVQYYYTSSAGCAALETAEGPGSVCPAGYAMTPVVDTSGVSTGAGACLACAAGSTASAVEDSSGNFTYSCTTPAGAVSAATQSSAVYQITMGDSSGCGASNEPPATTDPCGNLAGCTYAWVASGFSACTGGTGAFSYGVWSPATGCGSVTQTRSASCQATAGSATQTQTVTCERSDGTTVPASNCTGAAPPTSQSCTPTSGFSCGTAVTSQTVSLNNGCTYNWVTTPWAPATGSACTTTLNQTRSVTCQNTLGQTVANSNCAAPVPPASQTVTDTGGCTYAWTTGAYGSCAAGGTGTWQYGAWAPATGCGNAVAQTRTATCVVNSNSSTQTRPVTCVRWDGAPVADTFCPAAAQPAASQACTPASGFSCGVSGATSQSVALTSTCTYSWVPSGFGVCHVGP